MRTITIKVPEVKKISKTITETIGYCLVSIGNRIAKREKENEPKMIDFWTHVVGTNSNGRQEVIKFLTGNEEITLLVDHSEYKNAIGVFANNKKIGHLPFSIKGMIYDKMFLGKFVKVVDFKLRGGTKDKPRIGIWLKIRNAK